MKTLVLVLSLVMAGSAFAGTDFEAMSWASLLRSGKYDVDYGDKVHFQKASFWVPSFSKTLCTDGEFIYGGTRTVEVCEGEDRDENCRMKKVDLVQPIVSERQRCSVRDDNNCLAFETVVYSQSTNRMIKILAAGGDSDDEPQVLGMKSYSIPACNGLTPVPAN